jgi:hypothetical protein
MEIAVPILVFFLAFFVIVRMVASSRGSGPTRINRPPAVRPRPRPGRPGPSALRPPPRARSSFDVPRRARPSTAPRDAAAAAMAEVAADFLDEVPGAVAAELAKDLPSGTDLAGRYAGASALTAAVTGRPARPTRPARRPAPPRPVRAARPSRPAAAPTTPAGGRPGPVQ